MGSFLDELISKEGETLTRYTHSYVTSRDATTNLKVSKWDAGTSVTCVIRSQPSFVGQAGPGRSVEETILLLTKTQFVELDVAKWGTIYYDITLVEEVYMRKVLQYYRCTAVRRLEFKGA